MAQWRGRSLPINVTQVRFPAPVLYVGWVCYWFLSLLRRFLSGSSGFPPSAKNTKVHSKFQFNQHRGPAWKPAKTDVACPPVNVTIYCLKSLYNRRSNIHHYQKSKKPKNKTRFGHHRLVVLYLYVYVKETTTLISQMNRRRDAPIPGKQIHHFIQ